MTLMIVAKTHVVAEVPAAQLLRVVSLEMDSCLTYCSENEAYCWLHCKDFDSRHCNCSAIQCSFEVSMAMAGADRKLRVYQIET